MRKVLLLASVSLSFAAMVSGAGAQPAAPQQAIAQQALQFDEDADAEKAVRSRMARHNAKLKPIIAADPRAKALTAQILEAFKITDKRARKVKLDSLAPQILAVRNDAIAKANIKPAEVQTDLAPVEQKWKPRPPVVAPAKKEVVNVSSFPNPSTFKAGCNDESDKWDFDGKLVKIHAASTPADADCSFITAGRRTDTIDVPAGVNRVDVQASAKIELHTGAASFGFYAKAVNYWGLKILSPEGLTLSKQSVLGVMKDMPFAMCKLKTTDAVNHWPNPIPFDFGEYEADIQDGDTDNVCTFNLPPGIKKLEVVMYTSGWVDADVLGVAEMTNRLTPKSAKLTFVRP